MQRPKFWFGEKLLKMCQFYFWGRCPDQLVVWREHSTTMSEGTLSTTRSHHNDNCMTTTTTVTLYHTELASSPR